MRSPLVLGEAGQFRQQPGWQVATLTGTTLDKDTWVTLLEDGAPLAVPTDETWIVTVQVVARGAAGTGGFIADAAISGGPTLTLLGSRVATVGSNSNNLKVRVIADILDNALAVQVKGIKNETIEWLAVGLITALKD